MFAGGDVQGDPSYPIGYDTNSTLTVIPSKTTAADSGWFDADTTNSKTYVFSEQNWSLYYGNNSLWTVACELAMGPVCLS